MIDVTASGHYVGDCRELLAQLPEGCVQTCVTSPPYWGLRDYGVDGQIGLESTPDAYVEALVEVFRGVRRALRDDGTLWLNLGDSYASAAGGYDESGSVGATSDGRISRKTQAAVVAHRGRKPPSGLKAKDLVGVPWLVAFALRADGWYLRQDIIWCLSGGTWVYARTQKGDMPIAIKDLARLRPDTVQLWTGTRWTRLLGMSRSSRRGTEIEIVLRSGERISCTPTHRFPTSRGLLAAGDLQIGDVLDACRLPQPDNVKDCALDEDAAWLAGLYLAEGSRSGGTIQIAGHAKETERWERVQRIATKFGGTATRTVNGNCGDIRLYGRVLSAIIDELVTGRVAKDKGFAPVVWRYSDEFVSAMLNGYLSGDGHWDAPNNRWRLGFTRNYNLERDLRVACARLGYKLTLNLSSVRYKGEQRPTFRGEIRMHRSGHHNERPATEIVELRKARCREVWDLGVADDPHLFALASGVLTHNSKPNPMPESVTDRCTKAHEYLFLLSKSERYHYDAEAIAEQATYPGDTRHLRTDTRKDVDPFCVDGGSRRRTGKPTGETRNRRSVWTVASQPYDGAHFATFPPKLIEPCILAGSRPGDLVLDPFFGSGTTGAVAEKHGRRWIGFDLNPEYAALAKERTAQRSLVLQPEAR